jgi:hypothetical protein
LRQVFNVCSKSKIVLGFSQCLKIPIGHWLRHTVNGFRIIPQALVEAVSSESTSGFSQWLLQCPRQILVEADFYDSKMLLESPSGHDLLANTLVEMKCVLCIFYSCGLSIKYVGTNFVILIPSPLYTTNWRKCTGNKKTNVHGCMYIYFSQLSCTSLVHNYFMDSPLLVLKSPELNSRGTLLF